MGDPEPETKPFVVPPSTAKPTSRPPRPEVEKLSTGPVPPHLGSYRPPLGLRAKAERLRPKALHGVGLRAETVSLNGVVLERR